MKTQKTYMIIAVVGAVVIFLFSILYFATYEETDILNVSADEIKSIYVTNGSNGDMVDVPSSVFPDFAKALNEVKLKRGQKMESSGWDYGINLSDGKNEYDLSFVSQRFIVIGENVKEKRNPSWYKIIYQKENSRIPLFFILETMLTQVVQLHS